MVLASRAAPGAAAARESLASPTVLDRVGREPRSAALGSRPREGRLSAGPVGVAGQPRGFSGGLGLAMPVFCNESSSIHGFLLPCWREARGGWARLPVLGESQPAAEGQPRPSALRGGSRSGLTQGTRRSESAAARCTRLPWSCRDRPGVTHTFPALFPPSRWQGTRSSSSDERSRCLVRRCPAGAQKVTTGCTASKSRARLDPEGSSSKSPVRRAGA